MDKIMIVEDYKELREELVDILQEDYTVFPAETVKEGYTIFQRKQVNLCILDVSLPDGNGFELCEKIRKHSNVPIIFLTASVEEENVVKGLQLGADDYVNKPFHLKELLARIALQLKKAKEKECKCKSYISGDLFIELSCHRIFLQGQTISVTPIEYLLCKKLIEERGRTVTRDALMENVREMSNNYIEDNTLTVYLSRIKKKLGAFCGKTYIETVRGFGYRWGVPIYER